MSCTTCPPGCQVIIRAADAHVRLWLTGELDVVGAENVNRVIDLAERAELPLVLDCHDLTFIDAAGVSALLRVARGGGRVQGVRDPVRRVFTVLGLSEQLSNRPFLGWRPATSETEEER